jgi:hypothetical protein
VKLDGNVLVQRDELLAQPGLLDVVADRVPAAFSAGLVQRLQLALERGQ